VIPAAGINDAGYNVANSARTDSLLRDEFDYHDRP
jgi:hypothetical protein